VSLRLSVPSYVLPGTYVENLRFLDEQTDQRDVELLFFIFDDEARSLMRAEIGDIASYGSRFGFTVHMPDSIDAAHEEIIEATAGFSTNFIIHPPRTEPELPGFVALLDEWRGRYGEKRFLLENTRLTNFAAADAALLESRYGLPRICADIGHLRMEGVEPSAWVAARAGRIAEMHVHGFDGIRDHAPFRAGEGWLDAMAPFAGGFTGIVEIELFSWAELKTARKILKAYWEAP
jgi:sugar phosphate isomerase/epimerase